MNRLVTHNSAQGKWVKALCVCSAGALRSPTMAEVFREKPFEFNTRAAGSVLDLAIIPITPVLLDWADIVICANELNRGAVIKMLDVMEGDLPSHLYVRPIVHCLGIPDEFDFRDPVLVNLIKEQALADGIADMV